MLNVNKNKYQMKIPANFSHYIYLLILCLLISCSGGGGGSAISGASGDASLTASSQNKVITPSSQYKVIAWNDLGMHCMDHDYSVFSLLPPYNNLHAQLFDNAKGVQVSSGVVLTYEATADTNGSVNSTSINKTNFWTWVFAIFGVSPPDNVGLAGNPVQSFTPAAMTYDKTNGYWRAQGIPAVPYDDNGNTNYYPMVKVVARNINGKILATTKTVIPVSDEMNCNKCHSSGVGDPMAQPSTGWVNDPNPEKDWKRNILSLHDDKNQSSTVYAAALAANSYDAAGLLTTSDGGTPILCAKCHMSNALGTTGFAGVKQLTTAVHSWHGTNAMDDATGMPLDLTTDRSACYYCHPGSTTQCLRGAMGKAVDSTGTPLLQCQSCHGTMSVVGADGRAGWIDLPHCDGCHYYSSAAGRYVRDTSVFDQSGAMRNPGGLFGTNGKLYKLASAHGTQCEACHGSTHAEFPTATANDNDQNIALQGHAGSIAECSVCHVSVPLTITGGAHDMHTIGQKWVNSHGYIMGTNASSCAVCHGTDFKGMFLSKASMNRTFMNQGRKVSFNSGQMIGCYECHNGSGGH